MKLGARLRALEGRARVERRARSLCKLCGGEGKLNVSRALGDEPETGGPPEPCPGCGKVKLLRIIVPRRQRVTPETIPVVIVGYDDER